MDNAFECEVSMIWSIKMQTFVDNIINAKSTAIVSNKIKTIIDDYEYFFNVEGHNGDVAISFEDNGDMKNPKVKEMTLSIPSANFRCDMSKPANVPKFHYFDGRDYTVIIKLEDILNPDMNFFVNDILSLEFHGVVERKPESLGDTLWNAADHDFAFLVDNKVIKAHKVILGKYSSVFNEMFASNVNQIKIDDFKYGTVFDAVKFCYDLSPCFPKVGTLMHTIQFADAYDMPVIKERIAHKLKDFITTENVCGLANISLKYDVPSLRLYCIRFMSKCIKDGKTYGAALDLDDEIIKELYKSSVCHTVTS